MMRRQSTLEQYDTDIDGGPSQATYGDEHLPSSHSRPCLPLNDSGVHRWGTVQADETIPQIPQQCYEEGNPWKDPISVNVSIFRQLCGENLENSGQLWRQYPHVEDDTSVAIATTATTTAAAVTAAATTTTTEGEGEHEERRILERFASFGRPATPKNRRRNKRKGSDSPRLQTQTQTQTGTPQPPTIDNPQLPDDPPSDDGQGFDLAQLNDGNDGNEPVTSHGMRPARGWAASLDLFPDDGVEEVMVSPRVLSPETEESFHAAHRFAGGSGGCEQRERRTTFIALGRLRMSNRNRAANPDASDQHPAALKAKQLVALINSLKEKVKLYEDAFEQRYGYRPSHHQKMDDRNTKRILTELARSRKELKQLKERYHICDVVDTVESFESVDSGRVAAPWPDASAPASGRIQQPASIEQTVLEIQEHLAGNRKLAGRPEAVEELNAQEILDEKLAVQRALLFVESIHGRPASLRQKDLLRPLYDRYRILKRMVARSRLSRTKEESSELVPILEHETLELARPTPPLEAMDESTAGAAAVMEAEPNKDLVIWKRQKISLNIEENLHALPLNQLVEQLRHVREEKRQLRRSIRDLGSDMLRKGSTSTSSSSVAADEAMDGHLEPVQAQYRHARAKLRLLEALVAKHDGSATL